MYNFYIDSAPIKERIVRFLILIKHCFLLIIIPFLSVSASGHAQGITLSKKDVPLTEVFSEIRKQSNYDFAFTEKQLSNTHKVTVSVKNASINEVLEICFKGQPLAYSINNNTIIIKPKPQNQQTLPLPEKQAILGKVVSATTGEALPGAVIKIMTPNHTTISNDKGEFILTLSNGTYNISISHLSYKTKNISVQIPLKKQLVVELNTDNKNLQEVEIISTGYQNIPKERATGSFAQPDKKMFEARVSTGVISRLEGITSGLVFNSGAASTSQPLTIRGRSTIFSNTQPLIVIDNFPYDGDIDNINPNDVESITVLKDAAAASIWGAKSGNGVIIITTKKGKLNQDLKIAVNSNMTISSKPDLFYDPNTLSSSDLIDVEKDLFNKGFYAGKIASAAKSPISPVVALLEKVRLKSIDIDEANLKIEQMRNQDVRDDLAKYFYRNAFNQQYAINISGGNNKHAFYLSAGYDKNLLTLKENDFDRMTINFNNNFQVIDNLNINLGINYVQNKTQTDKTLSFVNSGINSFPYTILSDANNNPLPIGSAYSSLFTETIQNKGFLNWEFIPINELNGADDTAENKSNDIRLSSRIDYTIISGLKASVIYQYQRSTFFNKDLHRQESFYTRNLINSYSKVDATSGQVIDYNIPVGAILGRSTNLKTSNNTRGQLTYNKKLGKHELNIILGLEAREVIGESQSSTLYGYNEEIGTSGNVNTTVSFRKNPSGSGPINGGDGASGSIDRFKSYFGNGAYTYNDKYTLSASVRKDQSNLFGVSTNLKGVPLWSIGTKWDLSKEKFYDINWLPIFSFRTTYGFNGNINTTLTAVTTFQIFGGDATGLTNLPTARITNYGNPDLTWEKIGIFNIGIDFGSKNNIIYGSLEYFRKNGKDLIGDRLFAPTAGVRNYRGNYAATKGEGWDLQINTRNLSNNSFSWESSFLLSNATDKVTEYSIPTLPQQLLGDGKGISVYVGKPVNSIFSTKWAGLNPITGTPRGLDVDDNLSENYTLLNTPKTFDELVYNGPARPTIFGGLRNTVNYKSLSLSFNISYKLGYYFKRSSIAYNSLYSSYRGHQDYSLRWKSSGDELITNIPSAIYPANANRDSFFFNSEVLVEKADHIRLQDINVAYSFNSKLLNSIHFSSIQVYGYVNNIGLLWKATKTDLDPDFPTGGIINPKTFSFGIKASF